MQKNKEKFAELLGAFVGDGWISKGNSGLSLFICGNPKNETEYYERIKELFFDVFKLEVNPRNFPYWAVYGVLIGNQKVIQSFIETGLPIGNKASIVKVPDFIKNDKQLFIPFLRGLFDTDGCISFQKSYNKNASEWQKSVRHRPRVDFSTVSKDLSDAVFEMLTFLNFKVYKRKPYLGKRGKFPEHRLVIEGKATTKKFFELIKPQNQRHLKKFQIWKEKGFY